MMFVDYSVGNRFLQGTASDRVHVWSAGHQRHQWAAQTPDRLTEGQVHQGDQGAQDRDHPLWSDAQEIQSVQRH